ncbi:hypothetical protein LOK49_LG07G03507 [Camellia lanceoleosa]|uniref:Uncharacterized protein n=1 Tax=Camellia lanceoleosa TaxID=1840588 RepID=A0ACC0GYY7_9ERIC|nr:hypothetical protein LOK49_LG07G03507 [Camellia lanceoleosa]
MISFMASMHGISWLLPCRRKFRRCMKRTYSDRRSKSLRPAVRFTPEARFTSIVVHSSSSVTKSELTSTTLKSLERRQRNGD